MVRDQVLCHCFGLFIRSAFSFYVAEIAVVGFNREDHFHTDVLGRAPTVLTPGNCAQADGPAPIGGGAPVRVILDRHGTSVLPMTWYGAQEFGPGI